MLIYQVWRANDSVRVDADLQVMNEERETESRVFMVLHAACGLLCVLASLALGWRPGIELHWGWARKPLVAIGLISLLCGILIRRTHAARITSRVCIVWSSLLIALAIGESAFRIARYDFRRQEVRWRSCPPYYRQPMLPSGKVFFRRSGPEQWSGPVIKTYLQFAGCDPTPYASEEPITVKYDRFGFRNETELHDWDVAIAGDSFTELGHLPYDQLFTTMLGRRFNLRVLNLGVGNTGPLTQLSYLEDYAKAPSLKHVVIVFFEGNDIGDLNREYMALLDFEATGKRPVRQFRKQTSMLRALGEQIRRIRYPVVPAGPPVDAVFMGRTGVVQVTLGLLPPTQAELSKLTRDALQRFVHDYAEFAHKTCVRPWLVYMPCKASVLSGQIQPTEQAPDSVRTFKSTDLPALVAELCAKRGIRFVDLTPSLREETHRSGELLFNALYDTHLNARGSAFVAEELAKQLDFAADSSVPEPRGD